MEKFFVYKVKLAKGLMKLGYKLVDFDENPKNPHRTRFIFENKGNIVDDYYKIKSNLWQD